MSRRARRLVWRTCGTARFIRHVSLAIPALACFVAAPARAEVGAAVSVFSDARFRAHSLSGGHPVGILDLSYDDPDGFYAGASGSVVASSEEGLRPLGLQLNAGYAKRVSPKLTLDAGIVHGQYSHYSNYARGNSYTEFYGGFTYQGLSGRVSISPHYFHSNSSVLYGEINDSFQLASKLQLNAHAGLLTPLGSTSQPKYAEFDWRIGLSRRFGPFSAQVAWTGGRRIHGHYSNQAHTSDAIVVGLSWIL